LVYLGIEYDADIDEKEVAAVEKLVRNGLRLIVTFAAEAKRAAPAATPGPAFTPGPTSASPPTPTTTPNPPKSAPTPLAQYSKPKFHHAAEHWGVSFEVEEDTQRDAVHRIAVPEDGQKDLELSVQWHTALYLKGLDPAWSVLYRRDNVPVVIERTFGRGSIVLCTDSYFLSNEGLHTARAPKLVARLVGTPQTVVFDEFHNGVAENPNVAGLVKKHGLGGAVLALLGIAALFIWKNAAPFLPHRTDDNQGTHVRGFDAGQGFINLLRRGVPTSQLLELCVSEWRKTRGHRAKDKEKAHVDAVLRAHSGRTARDATAAYRTIATRLNRR
jgi:hypothetical protein